MNHLNRVTKNHLRQQNLINRNYPTNSNKNGTLFFVTVNSNRTIDPITHSYNENGANISYNSTIQALRDYELHLNISPGAPPAKIDNFAIEIGAKALRLHTHFTVLLEHSSVDHDMYHLNRNEIERIFTEIWQVDNIHVNVMATPYTLEDENRMREYMNQYIGPDLSNANIVIFKGPRYTHSVSNRLLDERGMYPMSRDPLKYQFKWH